MVTSVAAAQAAGSAGVACARLLYRPVDLYWENLHWRVHCKGQGVIEGLALALHVVVGAVKMGASLQDGMS